MKILKFIAMILLIVGGINWGLIGLMNINFVELFLGGTGIDRVIYILVGISAVWAITCFNRCCNSKGCSNSNDSE